MRIALLAALVLAPAFAGPAQDDDKVTIDLVTTSDLAAEAPAAAETTIGMTVELTEFVIPGDVVRAKPVADAGFAPLLVRIENVFAHGSAHRYNMEITPFVEGVFDLRDHLEREDGSALGDEVPEIRLLVDAVTDEAVPKPVNPDVPHPDKVGGYTNLMMTLAVLWGVGLVCLLFLGRGRKRAAQAGHTARPVTLAERLRPLVQRAGRGELEGPERAELERLVLAHWREKRGLEGVGAAEAMAQLRRDEEAGPLLEKLEQWFHSPRHEELSDDDIAALLAPYGGVGVPTGGGAA